MPGRERTLLLIMPGVIECGRLWKVFSMISSDIRPIAWKSVIGPSPAQLMQHFGLEKGSQAYDKTIRQFSHRTFGPVVLEGHDAIDKVRGMVGFNSPLGYGVTTINGMFVVDTEQKAVEEERMHEYAAYASGPESAADDIRLWFGQLELPPVK